MKSTLKQKKEIIADTRNRAQVILTTAEVKAQDILETAEKKARTLILTKEDLKEGIDHYVNGKIDLVNHKMEQHNADDKLNFGIIHEKFTWMFRIGWVLIVFGGAIIAKVYIGI